MTMVLAPHKWRQDQGQGPAERGPRPQQPGPGSAAPTTSHIYHRRPAQHRRRQQQSCERDAPGDRRVPVRSNEGIFMPKSKTHKAPRSDPR